MEHDVVSQARGAVDTDQDAVLDGGAEAHRQPVCPCARPLVVGPCVCDQTSSFTEDVCGASCRDTRSKQRGEAIRFILGETETGKTTVGEIQFCDVQTYCN